MSNHDMDNTQGLDFATIDELDPSLSDGFHVIYDREVPYLPT
jgi:hypothetical protein